MTVDSIIFDLDGTLWDATDVILPAWDKALEEYAQMKGVSAPRLSEDQIKKVMGLQISEIGKRLFPYLDESARTEVMARGCEIECSDIRSRGGRLFPGVEKGIKILSQNYPLFIVSNCQMGYIEAFQAAHHMEDYFRDYENPGRTGLSKGENIRLIVERNHLRNPVYVGDTEGDGKAAYAAGVPFIFARYGFGDVEKYDKVIDRFDQLVEILSEMT